MVDGIFPSTKVPRKFTSPVLWSFLIGSYWSSWFHRCLHANSASRCAFNPWKDEDIHTQGVRVVMPVGGHCRISLLLDNVYQIRKDYHVERNLSYACAILIPKCNLPSCSRSPICLWNPKVDQRVHRTCSCSLFWITWNQSMSSHPINLRSPTSRDYLTKTLSAFLTSPCVLRVLHILSPMIYCS
jgi:hypothetical protein